MAKSKQKLANGSFNQDPVIRQLKKENASLKKQLKRVEQELSELKDGLAESENAFVVNPPLIPEKACGSCGGVLNIVIVGSSDFSYCQKCNRTGFKKK